MIANALMIGDPNTILIGGITLAIVLVSLVTAIVGLFTAVRTARRAATEIQKISVNVDGHLSEVVARVDQLTTTLNEAGVNVPQKNPRYFPSDPTALSDSAQEATIEPSA
jgi:hypothetical protein